MIKRSSAWTSFHSAVSEPAPCVRGLVAAMQPCAGKRVLDLGCGTGRNFEPLLAASMHVTGVDIDAQALADARLRAGARDVHLATMSMTQLSFPSAIFDGVLAVSVLNHGLAHEVDAAFEEARRVLGPNAWFLVTMISVDHPTFGRGDELEPRVFAPWEGPDAGVPHRFFTHDELHRFLSAHGFDVVAVRKVGIADIGGINDGHLLALTRAPGRRRLSAAATHSIPHARVL